MQGTKRRVVHAISYELILLGMFAPATALIFHKNLMESAALGISLSVLALVWNMVYNYGFEHWERRMGYHKRALKQRIMHAVGFEGGFMVITVPIIAWFLQLSLWQTILIDIGFTIMVMMYTFIFQLVFDKLFGEPQLA